MWEIGVNLDWFKFVNHKGEDMQNIELSDWLTIVAILLGPIMAILVGVFLEKRRRNFQRKHHLFVTLMLNRATPASPDFVNALNMIEIEFYETNTKNEKVRDAWKALHDHLNNRNDDGSLELWLNERFDLQVDLLSAMGQALKYKFNKTDIKRSAYSPIAHEEIEADNRLIRTTLVKLLSGESYIPISFFQGEQDADETEKWRKLIEDFLGGNATLKVEVQNSDNDEVIIKQKKT